MNVTEAIAQLRQTEKRKFKQSFDLIVNIVNVDLKRPENKFSKDVILPHGRGKEVKVAIMSDSIDGAISKSDIENMKKQEMKKIVHQYDFFICEVPMMALVGKILGRYLGPKGKMPKPLPPGKDPKSLIDDAKKSVRVRLRDSPAIHAYVGTETMEDQKVEENIMHVIDEVKKSIPPKSRIKNAYLKLTMSKTIKIDTVF